MGNFFWAVDGIENDGLQASPEIPTNLWNVNVGPSAAIERGMLLGASSPTATFELVDDADDISKVLAVAAVDFQADKDHTVTQAYSSGVFHREKIILGGDSTLTLEPFEDQMRKSNLHLRSLKDKFGKVPLNPNERETP